MSELFGNLTSLRYLDLSGAGCSGANPATMCSLSNLEHLDLSDNDLRGRKLQELIGNLTNLRYLDLSGADFGGQLPNQIGNLILLLLPSLRNLTLSGCQLPPPTISSTLTEFNTSRSLAFVDLGKNNITSSVFKWCNYNTSLVFLDLSSNEGCQILLPSYVLCNTWIFRPISGIGGIICLFKLVKRNNPREHWEFDHARDSGYFHSDSKWVPPFQLESLLLNSCKMSLFPEWLQTQKNLDFLAISGSGISEIIPCWFCELFRYIPQLDLSCNEIKGTLADLKFEFAYHPAVNLSWNKLEGRVPSFLSKASKLDLSNNKFSKLDSFLCATRVSYLNYLDLSSNHMSGEIPNCWKQFGDLVFLDLSNNTFSGNIPSTLSSLSSTQTLKVDNNMFVKVDNNMFEGELPSSFKNCTNLKVFDIENNELSGPIPEWLGVGVSKLVIIIHVG
ncbi:receptor-like protein EIX2 [Argentina anserina]|uniref:receptor-like protein EIX2 n=1 Tax=Argentina anserina TaxID=57926 RepID=UPI0021767D7A|nr:receptor-like protein EIX2 [Potentilla anserina]